MSGRANGAKKVENKAVARLQEELIEIRAGWAWRRSLPLSTLSPYDKPLSFLKREIYRLARETLENRNGQALESLLMRRRERATRASAIADNPFHKLIVAEFDEEEIGRSEQRRVALELEYARRHRVPDEYLIGFILQTSAGVQLAQKVKDVACYEQWHPNHFSADPVGTQHPTTPANGSTMKNPASAVTAKRLVAARAHQANTRTRTAAARRENAATRGRG